MHALREPPTTDEFSGLILLRQAIDVLAAPADQQIALYPPGRRASREMAKLFDEAYGRVRLVFGPSLPAETLTTLDALATLLGGEDDALFAASAPRDHSGWDRARALAQSASRELVGRPGPPRAYAEQWIRREGRLVARQFA